LAQDEELVTFSVEPLAKRHRRADFSCGIEPLDRYLQRQASQDAKRGVAAPFVIVTQSNDVIGYCTLSAFSVDLPTLPAAQARKLPKYPNVPATLLGRLAVDQNQRGLGIGEFLLMDALSRSHRATSEVASYAVVVDDFLRFPETANRLFLPMNTIKRLFVLP
jgi:GNAT superfamily N-acetyltransferase